MNLKKISIFLALVILFASCGNNSKQESLISKIDEFAKNDLKDEIESGVLTKISYEPVRFATNHKSFYIINIIRTYNNGSSSSGTFAFNLDNFDVNLSPEEFYDWMYLDIGEGYENGEGIYNFSNNVAFVEYNDSVNDYIYGYSYDEVNYTETPYVLEETSPSTKDLEKAGALLEALNTKDLAEGLSSEFGLSEDRAYEVAKLSENWKKISNSREMTEADANLFLNESIGASYDFVKNAMKKSFEGDDSVYESLIDLAAEKNEVDPEHMREIVDLMIK